MISRFPLVVLLFLVGFVTAHAQVRYTPEQLHKHFQNMADSYQMLASGMPLVLREQPLMHWRNPERLQDQGALYVWEKNGRPHVLASIFTYEYGGNIFCRHEMLSLSDGPITSKLDSQIVWTPNRAGLQWVPFDDQTVPAESIARRLFQMRTIARQFSGTLIIPERQPSKLTLLPQPLIRYQAPEEGVIDGAIFSFAVGTDPEVLLVIEARKSDDGTPAYYFAPARSHYHAVELERDGKVVWSAPMEMALQTTRAAQSPYSKEPFFVFTPSQPLPTPEELK